MLSGGRGWELEAGPPAKMTKAGSVQGPGNTLTHKGSRPFPCQAQPTDLPFPPCQHKHRVERAAALSSGDGRLEECRVELIVATPQSRALPHQFGHCD